MPAVDALICCVTAAAPATVGVPAPCEYRPAPSGSDDHDDSSCGAPGVSAAMDSPRDTSAVCE
jgi:hypothetical protein